MSKGRRRTSKVRFNMTDKQREELEAIYDASEKLDREVMAIGSVELDEKTMEITLKEFFIPKQEATGANCEIDRADLAKVIMEGKLINFWFHTHPGMGAFWSGTDEDTARDLCGRASYFVSLVMGMAHRMQARVDFEEPLPTTADLDINQPDIPENPYYKKYLAEVRQKVKKKHFVVSSYGNSLWDDWDYKKEYKRGRSLRLPPKGSAYSNEYGYWKDGVWHRYEDEHSKKSKKKRKKERREARRRQCGPPYSGVFAGPEPRPVATPARPAIDNLDDFPGHKNYVKDEWDKKEEEGMTVYTPKKRSRAAKKIRRRNRKKGLS